MLRWISPLRYAPITARLLLLADCQTDRPPAVPAPWFLARCLQTVRRNLLHHVIRQRLNGFRRALFQWDSFTPHLATPVYCGQLEIIRVEKKLRFPLQAVETHLFHLKVEIPRACVRQIALRMICAI